MNTQTSVFSILGEPRPNRAQRVQELRELGFAWADMDEEPYWVDQTIAVQEDVYRELMAAARRLWMIFDKAVRFVVRRRDLYAMLAIPEVLWDGLDLLPLNGHGLISRYARFDFCVSREGRIKLLELNADTPTGYAEAAVATPWMCVQAGIASPNNALPGLVRAAWAAEQPDFAACAGYGAHVEDSGTIELLAKHSGRKIQGVDTLDLWVDEGVLRGADNARIERIFMLYPKEWMAVDEGGEALAYAVESGNLQLFNGLHAILLQSKGLQALIWGLHEMNAPLWSEREHEWIETYMLPTYNEPVFSGNYVSKAMFGREGGSVCMYDRLGELDVQDTDGFDTGSLFPRVYQERADLPEIALHTGTLRLLTGVFVINGEPCGLLGRAGGLITGNASHFVAMGVNPSC